jgi:hypothetical protein
MLRELTASVLNTYRFFLLSLFPKQDSITTISNYTFLVVILTGPLNIANLKKS